MANSASRGSLANLRRLVKLHGLHLESLDGGRALLTRELFDVLERNQDSDVIEIAFGDHDIGA